jgi:hypothetical protein
MNDIINKNFQDFTKDYLRIRTKTNSIDSFVFNKEQLFIQNVIERQKKENLKVRCIILKGRQIGSTTFISARGYYLINKYSGYRVFVLAHRRTATNNIFDIVQRYHTNTPEYIKQKASILKYKSIELGKNDSSYTFATAGSNEVARSDTIQFFHGSEVAFWKNSDNHLASVLMAVPDANNSEVILESTSNGPKGAFYELCMEAKAKKNDYELIFLPWYWHSDYAIENDSILLSKGWLDYGARYNLNTSQLKWAYLKNKMLNISSNGKEDEPCLRFYQEFPADITEAFKFSKSNNLIKLEDILKVAYDKNFYKNSYEILNISIDNNLVKKKFEEEKKHQEIVFGLDVASGGGDLTWLIDRQGSFLGFNINEAKNFNNTMEIVGWVANKIDKYSPKKVCIDAGGGGIGVYDRLKELGYENIVELIYFAQKANDSRKYLNKRAEMWCTLKEYLEDGNYIINDSILISQIAELEFAYNSNGQIQLEAKEKLKMRLKSSPDGADACALTFGCVDKAKINYKLKFVNNSSMDIFNPFDW